MRYLKKEVFVNAVRFNCVDEKSLKEILDMCGNVKKVEYSDDVIVVNIKDEDVKIVQGDWVVRDFKGNISVLNSIEFNDKYCSESNGEWVK